MNTSKMTTAYRAAASLGAVASWVAIIWMTGVLFFPNTGFVFGGLAVAISLWVITLAVAATVRCPKCGGRMLIVCQSPPDSLAWRALRERFFPVEAVTGRLLHHRCPYCNANVELANSVAASD